MSYIKNINAEEILSLSQQVTIQKGQIVSKTLAQNMYVNITLFAFSKGEEISTHESTGDAMVNVIAGQGKLTIDSVDYLCSTGETIIMPANKPHSLYAVDDFKMLLTVVFPV